MKPEIREKWLEEDGKIKRIYQAFIESEAVDERAVITESIKASILEGSAIGIKVTDKDGRSVYEAEFKPKNKKVDLTGSIDRYAPNDKRESLGSITLAYVGRISFWRYGKDGEIFVGHDNAKGRTFTTWGTAENKKMKSILMRLGNHLGTMGTYNKKNVMRRIEEYKDRNRELRRREVSE